MFLVNFNYVSFSFLFSIDNWNRRKLFSLTFQNQIDDSETYSSMCKSNSHYSCCFHDPWQRIPHKSQKLQYFVFLYVKEMQNNESNQGEKKVQNSRENIRILRKCMVWRFLLFLFFPSHWPLFLQVYCTQTDPTVVETLHGWDPL